MAGSLGRARLNPHSFRFPSTLAKGSSAAAGEITSWMAAHYTAQAVDGITIYDLTTPIAQSSARQLLGSRPVSPSRRS
jgi:hypothetical protein